MICTPYRRRLACRSAAAGTRFGCRRSRIAAGRGRVAARFLAVGAPTAPRSWGTTPWPSAPKCRPAPRPASSRWCRDDRGVQSGGGDEPAQCATGVHRGDCSVHDLQTDSAAGDAAVTLLDARNIAVLGRGGRAAAGGAEVPPGDVINVRGSHLPVPGLRPGGPPDPRAPPRHRRHAARHVVDRHLGAGRRTRRVFGRGGAAAPETGPGRAARGPDVRRLRLPARRPDQCHGPGRRHVPQRQRRQIGSQRHRERAAIWKQLP